MVGGINQLHTCTKQMNCKQAHQNYIALFVFTSNADTARRIKKNTAAAATVIYECKQKVNMSVFIAIFMVFL